MLDEARTIMREVNNGLPQSVSVSIEVVQNDGDEKMRAHAKRRGYRLNEYGLFPLQQFSKQERDSGFGV